MVQSNKVVVEKFYQAFDEFKSAPPAPVQEPVQQPV